MELSPAPQKIGSPVRPKRRRFPGQDVVEYLPVRLLVAVLQLFPYRFSSSVVRLLGRVIYAVSGKRRRIAMENLERAYGAQLTAVKKENISKAVFANLGLSILELFMVEKIIRDARRRFTMTGEEHFHAARQRGKGIILITSHLGSWEYLAFLFYLTNTQCSVIVKEIRNQMFNRYVEQKRNQMKLQTLSQKGAIRAVFQELKKNNTVAILIDQWAGAEGLRTSFFGTPTSTTSVPARLAKRTGAALLPAYCIRRPGGHYEIQVRAPMMPLDGEDWELKTTEALNRQLEDKIREYPEQWTWTHRRWKPLSQK